MKVWHDASKIIPTDTYVIATDGEREMVAIYWPGTKTWSENKTGFPRMKNVTHWMRIEKKDDGNNL